MPKTAEFAGNRRIYVSWLPDGGWGGNMVFRELIQHEDGTLGTRFVPELIPPSGAPAEWACQAEAAQVSIDGKAIRFESAPAPTFASLGEVPRDARITATLTMAPESEVARVGLVLKASAGHQEGCALAFEAKKQMASFTPVLNGAIEAKAECSIDCLRGLEGPFTVEIIVKGDIVDVCIDNSRTIITRYKGQGQGLCFFAQGARATIDNIEIRPLTE